ncbi:hypothetical protein [Sulfitobacter sp. S190]|uniref:hypothetical protein n=1 Tax=Sulfitobacter sp. S190 TaxID=2867022 RepID=UPI0021A73501|nr:hypothetical protein [Sulfitobacter sp. S190]
MHDVTLRRVRPDVDPVTRTRTALFEIDTLTAATFGQTATLILQTEVAARGTWVPVDALQQGSGSIWSVLVVEDGIVRTADVEVLHAQTDRAYVRGTFAEGAALIRTGAHRVVPGQEVRMLAEGA